MKSGARARRPALRFFRCVLLGVAGRPDGRGGSLRRAAAWGMHPPFSFVLAKENAPCTVEKKTALSQLSPWDMGKVGDTAAGGSDQIKFARSHPGALYAGAWQDVQAASEILGANLRLRTGRAFATHPCIPLRYALRGLLAGVGAMRRGGGAPPYEVIAPRQRETTACGAAAKIGAEAHSGFARFHAQPIRVAERER